MSRHLALYSLKSPLFEPHQLITHMFMHANFSHIFFNMFGVFMFGRILEQLWGSKKMLIFYTVTGLGAAVIHLTVNYFQMNHMIELANSFYNSPDYNTFNTIVNKYTHGRASLLNSSISCRNGFINPMIRHLFPRLKKLFKTLFHMNLRYTHGWCIRCGIRTADCLCHDVSRCGTHA